MPRIDDLLNLIQSANDIYLVNPSRNVRMAYIQIDNLCELVMKSWLQENISDWSPVSHSRGGRDYYKGFWKLADEVIQNNSDTELSEILERIKSRRENRNIFFHNHNLSGLTVNDQQCLGAFCDLYDLTEILFSSTFSNETKANHILRTRNISKPLEK
jgi:hypothetical protein